MECFTIMVISNWLDNYLLAITTIVITTIAITVLVTISIVVVVVVTVLNLSGELAKVEAAVPTFLFLDFP